MNDTWSGRIKNLCEQIMREPDPDKLHQLAKQLDQLVAEEQERRKQQCAGQVPTKN
jgi:hypothetical protein